MFCLGRYDTMVVELMIDAMIVTPKGIHKLISTTPTQDSAPTDMPMPLLTQVA
jgi:hypothetical protein